MSNTFKHTQIPVSVLHHRCKEIAPLRTWRKSPWPRVPTETPQKCASKAQHRNQSCSILFVVASIWDAEKLECWKRQCNMLRWHSVKWLLYTLEPAAIAKICNDTDWIWLANIMQIWATVQPCHVHVHHCTEDKRLGNASHRAARAQHIMQFTSQRPKPRSASLLDGYRHYFLEVNTYFLWNAPSKASRVDPNIWYFTCNT